MTPMADCTALATCPSPTDVLSEHGGLPPENGERGNAQAWGLRNLCVNGKIDTGDNDVRLDRHYLSS